MGLVALVFLHRTSMPAIVAAAVLMTLGMRLQLISGSVVRCALTPEGAPSVQLSVGERVPPCGLWSAGSRAFSSSGRGWGDAPPARAHDPAQALLPALSGERDPRSAIRQAVHSFEIPRSEKGLFRYAIFFSYWNWTWSGAMAVMVFFYRHMLHFSAADVGLAGLLGGAIPLGLSIF